MSAITATATLTETRYNLLGPLTTVFTADPKCMTLNIGECGSSTACNGWLDQKCGQVGISSYSPSNEVSCWPSWTSDANTLPSGGWGFYSPGLECPLGYTSACSSTAGGTGNFQFQFPLTTGETAVGCCPISYNCVSYNNQMCFRTVATATYTALQCSGSLSRLTAYTVPSSVLVTSSGSNSYVTVSSYLLTAQVIQLNWRVADRSTSTNNYITTTTIATASIFVTNTPSTSPTPPVLAIGAKIGIGLSIFLAVILGAAVWYLLRRNRNRIKTTEVQTHQPVLPEMDGKQIYEVDTVVSVPISELPSHYNKA